MDDAMHDDSFKEIDQLLSCELSPMSVNGRRLHNASAHKGRSSATLPTVELSRVTMAGETYSVSCPASPLILPRRAHRTHDIPSHCGLTLRRRIGLSLTKCVLDERQDMKVCHKTVSSK